MYRAFVITALAIVMLAQPASAQNATPNGTYVGQALGTALITYPDSITGNAVDAVYTAAGTVTVDVEGNDVTVMFTDVVVTPPKGFVKPAGYPGPTTSFTMGEFGTRANRTPVNYPTLSEPWFSSHGEAGDLGRITPFLPGFPGGDGSLATEGVMTGRLITGSMSGIMSPSPPLNPYITMRLSFIAVATK